MDTDWKGNSASYSTTSGFRNLTTTPRAERDFYATSPIALERLLSVGETFENVWECACGNGHLCNVLKERGICGRCSDIVVRDYPCERIDFLSYDGVWSGDILTNPPYRWATQFVLKALEVVEEDRKVVMFFPQRYLSSKGRYRLFKENPPKRVWAFSRRVSCALNGDFSAHSSNAVDYMWVIWVKGWKGSTILDWIY